MLLAALLSLRTTAALPNISVKQIDHGYRAEATAFEPSEESAVFAVIARRAADLCAGKQIKWGKFGSSMDLGEAPGTTPPKVGGYFKEFRCVAEQNTAASPAPADWKPSEADEAYVRRFAETYFAKRDAGEMDAAFLMYSPTAVEDRAEWMKNAREFNDKLGTGKRRITAVTWYVNPPAADQPGVFAAVDFVGDYPKTHIYCGYIGLIRRGPGNYAIVREEQNVFAKSDGQADPVQLEQLRAAMCRG